MTRDLNDPIEFGREVAASTFDIARMRALWVPAVLFSLGADTAVAIVEWPLRAGLAEPPERAFTTIVLVILAKGWFSLTLCRIALAGLRGQMMGVLNQWVSVQDALRIGVVVVALVFPIVLGLLCLVAPGLYLLARWSQVTMVLIDNRAQWFDAAEQSSSLTKGFRAPIIGLLLVLGILTGVTDYAVHGIVALEWIHRAVGSTVGAAFAAALYYQLSRRAPWDPESQSTS